jgi:glycerol-3-phosphate dehydrogenase
VTTPLPRPVLILGAGINGCCVARELALHGVPTVVADQHDIATGATSRSSRLIHGGVRYLEYGDFQLVRESLDERSRLLRLAPQFVTPLRLHIPVRRRRGGLLQSGLRFLKFDRWAVGRQLARRLPISERGLWTVRIGLWLYDTIARRSTLPRHAVHAVSSDSTPRVDQRRYRWTCAYSDAQMLYPERFVLALLEDARRAAAARGAEFRVLPYHQTTLHAATARLSQRSPGAGQTVDVQPSTIVNASGAAGDATLQQLGIRSGPLFGGTKGSHLITRQPALLAALGGDGVYAEAADGRLVFVLPFDDAVLIGTTDIPFSGPPEAAVASADEIRYLVGMVNEVFPDVQLLESHVHAHYCGVRPLPNVNAARAGAIPRGHWIDTNTTGPVPVDTLIGGKLTTCRQFGEEAADRILARLGVPRTESTRERPVPGADGFLDDSAERHSHLRSQADKHAIDVEQARALWKLLGSRAEEALLSRAGSENGLLSGTPFPLWFVDWVIRHEWVTRVEDLVERRLMLAWSDGISRSTLVQLAERLALQGRLPADQIEHEASQAAQRLAELYGRALPEPPRHTPRL